MENKISESTLFRAPVYSNIRETIKGLYKESIWGFYKGNIVNIFSFGLI